MAVQRGSENYFICFFPGAGSCDKLKFYKLFSEPDRYQNLLENGGGRLESRTTRYAPDTRRDWLV